MEASLNFPTETPLTEDLLLNCIENGMSHFKDEEVRAIMEMTSIKTFKKGTILLHEGEIPSKCFYNYKGCVRQFYLKDGEERTTSFFTENQSVTSTAISTGGRKQGSKYYLECIEDTTLSIASHEQELELFKQFPKFETLCRIETERELTQYQEKLAYYIMTSPEERYLNLLNNRSELINRVPLYQLASYIGIKPETLSRIRKRILMK